MLLATIYILLSKSMQPQSPFIRLLQCILKGHFVISLGAVALCIETNLLLQQALLSNFFYAFVFFATLFTYNFYYVKDVNFRYASLLSIIGLLGSITCFLIMPYQPIFLLTIIAALSILYIIPVFISIHKPEAFNVQKLFLLIIIWVITTHVMPQTNFIFNDKQWLLLVYRSIFISLLCLLFFIRDEINIIIKRRAILTTYAFILLQYLVCIYLLFVFDIGLFLILSLITSFILLLTIRFANKQVSAYYYLAFVDGLMCLELIFVAFKTFYINES